MYKKISTKHGIMTAVFPPFIPAESIISYSPRLQFNNWNEYDANGKVPEMFVGDNYCYPQLVLWVQDGIRRITEISCISSKAFGGECECINHSPYVTYREDDFVGDSRFAAMVVECAERI